MDCAIVPVGDTPCCADLAHPSNGKIQVVSLLGNSLELLHSVETEGIENLFLLCQQEIKDRGKGNPGPAQPPKRNNPNR
jgi:hypothetical protein